MADSVVSLVQLALRAGQVARGDALIPSIQKKKAYLVLMAPLCGANRKKKINDKCQTYNIPIREIDQQQFDAISPFISGALAITDEGFAQSIERAIDMK